MTVPNPTADQTEETPAAEAQPSGGEQQPPADKAPETPAEEQEEEEGSQDAAYLAKELERVRREAAAARVQNRELKEKLEQAKTPEEYQAAVADYEAKLAAAELTLARERVAAKYELPDWLAARLQGETPEDLETDAAALAEQFGAVKKKQDEEEEIDPDALNGGLDPSKSPDRFDPVALIQQERKSRNIR